MDDQFAAAREVFSEVDDAFAVKLLMVPRSELVCGPWSAEARVT